MPAWYWSSVRPAFWDFCDRKVFYYEDRSDFIYELWRRWRWCLQMISIWWSCWWWGWWLLGRWWPLSRRAVFDGNEFHLCGLMMMAAMVLVLMMVTAIMVMMKMMMLLLTSPGTVRLPPVPQGNGWLCWRNFVTRRNDDHDDQHCLQFASDAKN